MDNNNPSNRDDQTVRHEHEERQSTSALTVVLSIIALIILLVILAFVFGAFRAVEDADIDVQVPTPNIQEQLPESEQSAPQQDNTQPDDTTPTDQQSETEPTN